MSHMSKIMTTQKGQSSSRKFTHFAGNSAEGLGSRSEHCLDYMYLSEYAQKVATSFC